MPSAEVLEEAYRREVRNNYIREQVDEIEEAARQRGEDASLPDGLVDLVQVKLKDEPALPLDQAIPAIVGDADEDE